MSEDKGEILFLLICSNHKKEGGIAQYDKSASIRSFLPESNAKSLFQARDKIRKLITSDSSVVRDGEKLRDHPYNLGLVDGPDFQRLGLNHGGKYLPAAERYDGSFYQPLGGEKVSLLTGTPHHVLIISGLYGLLTPTEPIQLYSCHVPDDARIAVTWNKADCLTEALVGYMVQNNIRYVFELMADANYLNLLDWERLHKVPGVSVLHAISEKFRGPAQLRSFGWSMRTLVQESPEVLTGLHAGSHTSVPEDDVTFQDRPMPGPTPVAQPPSSGHQTRRQAAESMRNNITIMLNTMFEPVPREPGGKPVGFAARIHDLVESRRLDGEIGGRMRHVARLRTHCTASCRRWKQMRAQPRSRRAWWMSSRRS